MVAASAASTIRVICSRLRLLLAAMNSFIYMLRRAAYSWDGSPELTSPQLGAMQCRIRVDILAEDPGIRPSSPGLRWRCGWLYYGCTVAEHTVCPQTVSINECHPDTRTSYCPHS